MKLTNSKLKKLVYETIKESSGDHEGKMAKSQLERSMKYSKMIYKIIDNVGKGGEVQFPAWVQSKLTKAEDYLQSVYNYLDGKDGLEDKFQNEEKLTEGKSFHNKKFKSKVEDGYINWEVIGETDKNGRYKVRIHRHYIHKPKTGYANIRQNTSHFVYLTFSNEKDNNGTPYWNNYTVKSIINNYTNKNKIQKTFDVIKDKYGSQAQATSKGKLSKTSRNLVNRGWGMNVEGKLTEVKKFRVYDTNTGKTIKIVNSEKAGWKFIDILYKKYGNPDAGLAKVYEGKLIEKTVRISSMKDVSFTNNNMLALYGKKGKVALDRKSVSALVKAVRQILGRSFTTHEVKEGKLNEAKMIKLPNGVKVKIEFKGITLQAKGKKPVFLDRSEMMTFFKATAKYIK